MRWTWDGAAKAGYIYVDRSVHRNRTVDVGSGVMVDADAEGRIFGVEVLNAEQPTDMFWSLLDVLSHCRLVMEA